MYSPDPVRTFASDAELRDSDESLGGVRNNNGPRAEGKNDNFGTNAGISGRIADGIASEQSTSFHPPSVQDIDGNSSQYSNYMLGEAHSNSSDGPLKDFSVVSPVTSAVFGTNLSPEKTGSIPLQNKPGYTVLPTNGPTFSSYEDGASVHSKFLVPDVDEMKRSNAVGHSTSDNGPSLWSSVHSSTSFSFDVESSSTHLPWSSAAAGRRSRPSFLNSISPSLVSSGSQLAEAEKGNSSSSKVYPVDVPTSSAPKNSMNSIAINNGGDLFRHGVSESMERKQEFYSAKQDEDFTALEQHIEDLTQEKFSLQRALEASRVLAESLATENSALTDSYNQQGGVVHQLKSDMEMLQEELKAQLVELEAVKIEYGNAQLECNAADERAKLLASEVIGLEEKALRLRSNELKLERELENLQAEMSSYRKKISSLEKDRQDLQLTINALQEEKKLLQSKLRKASSSGKFVDVSKSPPNRREVSTSTEDLVDGDDGDTAPVASNLDMLPTALLNANGASSSNLQPDSRQYTLENLSLSIPSDQMRMIQNINTLISELALEKEELRQALSAESSQSSKLKELNKELSLKLEVQTQRLELLTSQSMANDYVPAKPTDSRTILDNTAYADEGDEVVERVLGWIMKLFPGGPSRRRTSKLI